MPERRIDIDEFWREPDRSLKLNSIQKHIISFARKHQGTFSVKDYEKHLNETVEDVKQRNYLLTRKNNACAALVKSGYLIERHRGEYQVNPLVLNEISEQRRKEPFEIKDNHIKLLIKNNNGLIIKSELKKEHSGKSEKEKYRQEKMIDGMIRNLTANDFLESQGKGAYKLTALAYQAIGEQEKTQKKAERDSDSLGHTSSEFEIKPNHIKILSANKDGIINKADLIQVYQTMDDAERLRQFKIIDGMIRNLKKNGFIENIGEENYRLTEKANKVLEEGTPGRGPRSKPPKTERSVITKFDRILIEVANEKILDWDKVNSHPRKDTIIKRIESLRKLGYIKENRLTDDLLQRIKISSEFSRNRQITMESLSKEQQQTLTDIRKFFNLYRSQIEKYIYSGDSIKCESEMKFLLDKGLLVKDKLWDIFVLGEDGVKMTNSLFPNATKYKTKVYSRREEVGHDALVYTTFKHFEETAAKKNLKIIDVKTDRQLRSEDAKQYGAMVGAYPDLWVKYLDPVTKKEHVAGLEVDIQYDERTIEDKILGTILNNRKQHTINTLKWYCNKASQMVKVAKVLNRLFGDPKSRNVTKAKYLELFFIDNKGNVHPYRWR